MLLDDEGRWVEGSKKLKEKAVEFYTKLFKTNDSSRSDFIHGHFPNLGVARRRSGGRKLEWKRRREL